MAYPIQIPRTYVNPQGNVIASGIYRSYLTQELANDFPEWMHLRQNPRSAGQQLMASTAIHSENIEKNLEYNIRSKFLNTAPVDEVDILYRVGIPSDINLLDSSASGIRCVTAPPGCSPSGSSQIWVEQVNSLEDFYYNVLPTSIQIDSDTPYVDNIDSVKWHLKPSGIADLQSKKYDVWKKSHDISWCFYDGMIRKQDVVTMEDYERYAWNASGVISDMFYRDGMLWCIGQFASGCYIHLVSTKTQEPNLGSLDLLATFDITPVIDLAETLDKILIDEAGDMWVSDISKTTIYSIRPRYDYFTVDKRNRYVYMLEDYRSPGVIISNT